MEMTSEIVNKMKAYRRYLRAIQDLADWAKSGGLPLPWDAPLVPVVRDPGWWGFIDCEGCDCRQIEAWIQSQLDVVSSLRQYQDFSQPFPHHQTLSNAEGAPDIVEGLVKRRWRRFR